MTETPSFDEIADNFSFLDDWEDRYRYVIDLGRAMDPLPEDRRSDAAKVTGCASQVWLVPTVEDGPEGQILTFRGDSDAMIVRGLIAILMALISGRTLAEIRAMNIASQLERLHLGSALSSQRSNGLRAMVSRIEDIARSAGHA